MRFRLPITLCSSLLGLAALSGCMSPHDAPPHVMTAVTPTEQFAVQVAPVADEIRLAPHGWLSPAQSAALGELAMRWRETGESPIVIGGPSAGPGAASAQAAAQALQNYGVPPEAVQVKTAPVVDGSEAPAPVTVGFTRLAATGPHCAGLWDEFTRTGQNLPHANFGCAVTANFAAQLADPRDLTRARTMTASDGDRRATVMSKYRAGEATSTERSDGERGVVSDSIQ